jgi:hypothetical protein
MSSRHLTLVACAAGPATDIGTAVGLALGRDWTVSVVATPAAMSFVDGPELERLTGEPVRGEPRDPATRRRGRRAGAILVAPATFNTINKLAAGIADNYAATLLAEAVGARVPMLIVPFVNEALASRMIYARSLQALRAEGVAILAGEDDGWLPHPPGTGEERRISFPWRLAVERITGGSSPVQGHGQPEGSEFI